MTRSIHHAVYPEGEVMMALSHATPYLIHDLVMHPADILGAMVMDEVFGGCAKAGRSRRDKRSINSFTLGGRR